ncbi:MAG: FAD-dependent oxidoreductase [Helicobacteraceae bacterium]|jgi:formate dehydrogenase beta subunit|nr:FAD-dependent oxidoreductase [Helicobacteraceae bacterium]
MTAPWFSSWRGKVVDNRARETADYERSELRLPAQFDGDRKARAFIGWDGVGVFDPEIDILRLASEYVSQYQNYSEACGRCMPGRAGGRILFDILDKIARGEGEKEDLEKLRSAIGVMKLSAKCEIGRTVPNAIDHLLTHFGAEFDQAIREKKRGKEYGKRFEYAAKITAPCVDACPDRVDIPAFIEGVRDRNPLASLAATRKFMPLAHTCGRVCPHPCEDSCRRGNLDAPLSIMELKRIGADYEDRYIGGINHAIRKKPPIGKKVAIVGAGPAGLTAGYYLAMNGAECDIFEALPVAGGEVMVGVPEYRMPVKKYLADIKLVEDSGAKIHLNSHIDSAKLLKMEKEYDAILLAYGARISKKLHCENENEKLKGYWSAINFLDQINLYEKFGIGEKVDFTGKTIVCVGGGFTSIDVVRCAIRANAKRVIMLYRRSEKVIIQNTSAEEYHEAVEEGVEFMFRSAIAKIIDEKGVIKRVLCNKFKMIEDPNGGRPQLTKLEGADFEIKCDYVIPAVSQESDNSILPPEWEIELTSWGTIKTDGKTYATNKKGVFSAGDCEYGPMTIVNAVGQGRRAANVALNYLQTGEIKRQNDEVMEDLLRTFRVFHKDEKISGYLGGAKRGESAKLSVKERKDNHREVKFALDAATAYEEASRCMRCYYIAMVALR